MKINRIRVMSLVTYLVLEGRGLEIRTIPSLRLVRNELEPVRFGIVEVILEANLILLSK